MDCVSAIAVAVGGAAVAADADAIMGAAASGLAIQSSDTTGDDSDLREVRLYIPLYLSIYLLLYVCPQLRLDVISLRYLHVHWLLTLLPPPLCPPS